MRLEGKRILITGAGSGIGRALAQRCAERGARLILAGRRSQALEETLSLLPASQDAAIVATDLASAAGRSTLYRAVLAGGGLDVLVNNAGTVLSGPFDRQSDHETERLFAINVLAPMAIVRTLLPLLRASAEPRIVNVGSVFGDIGHPLFAAYGASKFALRGFSDAIRRELASEGIGVTYVAPRATRTPAADGFAALVSPFGMTMDSAEVAADNILRAIEREAPTAYARGAERFFVWVQRLLPGLIDQALARKHQAWQQQMADAAPAPARADAG